MIVYINQPIYNPIKHSSNIMSSNIYSPEQKAIIKKLQLKIKLSNGIKKWRKEEKKSKHRFNILKQWIETEKSYINDLKIIQNNIQLPLKNAKLITEQEQRILFPNMAPIIGLSEKLYSQLTIILQNWNPHETMVGQQIMYYHKFFMIYRDYCNNFLKGQKIIKKIKTNPQALKIEQMLKLDFESYTIKPVQRPPKYQLLLREYQKALCRTHKDYQFVHEAINKYHDVNEMNNQSMDRQIRDERMIELEKKYSGIISNKTGRVYLKQFQAVSMEYNCRIYVFNDMLLVTRKITEQNDQLYKRIMLDHTSYAYYPSDGKYFINKLFICGATVNIHLNFNTPADCKHFYKEIDSIIGTLYQKQNKRRTLFCQMQAKRRNLAKFRVSKWYDDRCFSIAYKPKFEITTEGVSRNQNRTQYVLKFQTIKPFVINETLYLHLEELQNIQEFLTSKYKMIQLPKIDIKPQNMHFYQIKKNKTKITEYRCFLIEEFLNFVYRSEQFQPSISNISEKIGLNLSFLQFSVSQNFQCNCQICLELNESGDIVYYQNLIKQLKLKAVQKRQSKQPNQLTIKRQTFYSKSVGSVIVKKQQCIYYVFRMMNSIRQINSNSITSLSHRLLYLESHMGSINYSIIPNSKNKQFIKNDNNQIQIIKIYIFSISEEFIQINLRQDLYVRQILEEIKERNCLKSIYDFGLFYDEYGTGELKRIDNDVKIISFLKKNSIEVESSPVRLSEEEGEQQNNGFFSKLLQIKKWGQQLMGSKKIKIYLKKRIYLEPSLEIQGCKENKERYHFMTEEIFSRFHNETINLEEIDTVTLCSLYFLKIQFQKIKYYTRQNFQLTMLKNLLPLSKQNWIRDQKFVSDVYHALKKEYEEILFRKNVRNAIEDLYIKVMNLLGQKQQWVTQYFSVENYEPVKLKGELRQLLLGVNLKSLSIKPYRSSQKLLEIPLTDLKYKITTLSIFIETKDISLRFDGKDMLNIKKLLETYLKYNCIFLSNQT